MCCFATYNIEKKEKITGSYHSVNMCEPIIREGETEANRALIITDGEMDVDDMMVQAFALNSNEMK